MNTTTQYKTSEFTIGKTKWMVTVASGTTNYVSVLKASNNPFATFGKEFANFDEAIANYKNPKMKAELQKLKEKSEPVEVKENEKQEFLANIMMSYINNNNQKTIN